jgi:signal transduction histidine kinase
VLSLLARRIDSVFHTAQLYQKDIERKEVLDCERKRIAKDIHDDIGASMTRLHLLSEMAKNNPADAVKTKQWLEQISETSDKVMQGMNQIVWALDPKNESFEDVIAYIRRYTMEYLDPTPINCYFNLPEEIPDIQLNIQERRNIYLCFRESLNNMIKHSGAKNVYILIKKTSTHFTIEIKDDGEGFDPKAHEVSGNGLTNMKKRMKDIGGRIEISSEIGKGTEMTLTIPTKSKQ